MLRVTNCLLGQTDGYLYWKALRNYITSKPFFTTLWAQNIQPQHLINGHHSIIDTGSSYAVMYSIWRMLSFVYILKWSGLKIIMTKDCSFYPLKISSSFKQTRKWRTSRLKQCRVPQWLIGQGDITCRYKSAHCICEKHLWISIWYDMIYDDMTWYMIWYDMIYDIIWYDIWYNMIW